MTINGVAAAAPPATLQRNRRRSNSVLSSRYGAGRRCPSMLICRPFGLATGCKSRSVIRVHGTAFPEVGRGSSWGGVACRSGVAVSCRRPGDSPFEAAGSGSGDAGPSSAPVTGSGGSRRVAGIPLEAAGSGGGSGSPVGSPVLCASSIGAGTDSSEGGDGTSVTFGAGTVGLGLGPGCMYASWGGLSGPRTTAR